MVDLSVLEALRNSLAERESEIARRVAEQIQRRIAENWSSLSPAPVGEPPAQVSGQLAESIQVIAGYLVGSSVGYGAALEFGTGRLGARPWLRPAVEQVRGEVAEIAKAVLA